MSAAKKITVELQENDQVLHLGLNAPRGNVLDIAMMSAMIEALNTVGGRGSVKVIVFEGVGEHFSFGASVAEHRAEFAAEMLQTFHQLFKTLITLAAPTLAIVRGQCLGGGLELAAFCQWIFAHDNAAFGQPEIKLAVFPPAASLILPYRIGQAAADDLILTGRSISAAEAQAINLVHAVSADPAAAAHEFIAEQLLPKSAAALKFAVRASRLYFFEALLHSLARVEALYLRELMKTRDANEGIAAFLDKRRPEWLNR